MGSKLNDAAKKDLKLGVTGFSLEKGKEIEFPPAATKKYPISVSERALREYIARGGEILVIPVENDKQQSNKKEAALEEK